jgi:hypothetical protein
MIRKTISKFLYCALSLILFYNFITMSAQASSIDFFGGREVYGKPLEEYAKEYWQWWISLPPWGTEGIPKDPNTNLNKCIIGLDSDEKMIFLFDPFLENYNTKCTISSEKYILVPLLIGECDQTVEGEDAQKYKDTGDIRYLWKCAEEADTEFASWKVILDNKVLFANEANVVINSNLKEEILVRNSQPFNLTIPKVNHFDIASPGTYTAVVDGYYFILKPLSPGAHILEYSIKRVIPVGLGTPGGVEVGSAKYQLTVV